VSEEATASGALELVRRFVNTRDVEHALDELATPAGYAAWLAAHDLPAGRRRPTASETARARDVREAIRALLLANNGEELDAGAIDALNRVAARVPVTYVFDRAGRLVARATRETPDAALATILGVMQEAMLAGTWPRLKACRWDDCQWAFYDRSKNHSRSWCSMAVCGNRAKSRSYRARRTS
jgi:predicted RNA-binding Zn ribbon-like protein